MTFSTMLNRSDIFVLFSWNSKITFLILSVMLMLVVDLSRGFLSFIVLLLLLITHWVNLASYMCMGLVCQKSCPQRKVPLPPSSTISCSISSVKYRDLGAPSPFMAQCWLTWSYTMVCRQAQLLWVESCCSHEHAQKSPFPLHLSVLTLLQPTLLWFFPPEPCMGEVITYDSFTTEHS